MGGGARGPFEDWSRWGGMMATELCLRTEVELNGRLAEKWSTNSPEPIRLDLATDLIVCGCETT